jgi:hypothetical protein
MSQYAGVLSTTTRNVLVIQDDSILKVQLLVLSLSYKNNYIPKVKKDMGRQILSFRAKARRLNKVISDMQCINFPCTHSARKVTAVILIKQLDGECV